MTKERFRRLFDYEEWANRRTLESIREASKHGRCVELFAHILAAQEVWLTRLAKKDSSEVPVWPENDLTQCSLRLDLFAGTIDKYLDELEEGDLEREIEYYNQTGATFTHSPLEILTHLGLHSQHHRGQIAHELRGLGEEPAATDYIVFLREED